LYGFRLRAVIPPEQSHAEKADSSGVWETGSYPWLRLQKTQHTDFLAASHLHEKGWLSNVIFLTPDKLVTLVL
jgi:hypothetical protein